MPQTKAVPPLRVRAFDAACSFVLAEVQKRRCHGLKASSRSDLPSALPTALLGDLLSEILLHRPELEAEERLAVLRLLLRDDVRALSTGTFPARLHVAVLDVIRRRGAGLRHLDLRGVWTRDGGAVSSAALVAMVAGVPRLEFLAAPHSCTDAFLEAIASHCHHLQVLDVSGEGVVGASGIEALVSSSCAPILQKVDLGCRAEARVEPSVVARLLMCAPRLRSLGSYASAGSAVAALSPDSPPTQLTYVRDTATTLETADALMRLCPLLQSAYLDSPQIGVLPKLAALPEIRSLKLRAFRMADFRSFLEKAGPRILALELVGSCDEHLSLETVAAYCSKLERLDCGQVPVAPHVAVSIRFPSLRALRIGRCLMSAGTVRTLARTAPNLESIVILTPLPDLEDSDVSAFTGAHVAEVWLRSAPRLTQDAVLTLMSSAPRLRIIGDLAGWDVDVHSIIQLRSVMAECNLDLALWTSDALDEGNDLDAQQDQLDDENADDSDDFELF